MSLNEVLRCFLCSFYCSRPTNAHIFLSQLIGENFLQQEINEMRIYIVPHYIIIEMAADKWMS